MYEIISEQYNFDRYIILKALFNFFGWKCYTMRSMKEQHIAQDLFVAGGFMKQITKDRNEIK